MFKKPAADNVVASREFCNHGLCALQDGQLPEAEVLFQQALEVSPYDERARRCYADTLWRQGKMEPALKNMEEAVRLSGDDPDSLVQLGRMYFSGGNLTAADRAARKALAKQRDLASAWSLLADIEHSQGRYREALAGYHRAISCGDQSDAIRLAIADIYTQMQRYERALATLNALSERYTPEEEPAACLQQRGIAMQQLGRHREAVDCLALAANRGNPSAELLCRLSEAQIRAGDDAAARRNVALALESSPAYAPALRISQQLQSSSPTVAATDLR
jgi:tetratricopeptide (TPR) repeat protein